MPLIKITEKVGTLENSKRNCECVTCKNNFGFSLPKGLIDDFMSGNVVIFAGAGISTENYSVLKQTLYDSICYELDLDKEKYSFPDVMQHYVDKHNGRVNLYTKVIDRFKRIESFPELSSYASRFHDELCTFYPIDTIVTTNWDRYFEDNCAALPFVNAEDIAFWDATRKRKVLKIHGSIDNFGSIVATRADYKKCEKRLHRGMIGSVLKVILATKTIVFVGYSTKDEDFKSIFSFVRKELKGFHRHSYIVSPHKSDDYAKLGIEHIQTDGTYFIQRIKEHALVDLAGHYLPDAIYDFAGICLRKLKYERKTLVRKAKINKFPQVIMCASYQDGIRHGFEQTLAMRTTGFYSHRCNIQSLIRHYSNDIKPEKIRIKKYEDVAYVEGFIMAFVILLSIAETKPGHKPEFEFDELPFYFVFNSGYLSNIKQYMSLLPSIPTLHKGAQKRAEFLARRLIGENGDEVIYTHRAWL